MLDITFGGAFLAGLISFASPCVLPIVPAYLGFLAGVSFDQLKSETVAPGAGRKIILSAVAFVLGFSTVFVALGATAGIIGSSIVQYFDILAIIAGVIITAMGLHFLGVFRIGFLFRDLRFSVPNKPAGLVGAYVVGLTFAFGWTPCVGPILAAILFVAGATETARSGAVLLGVYAAGLGLPFVIAGIFASRFLNWSARFREYLPVVEKAMGGILVITGVLIMTGQMAVIAFWLLETFPIFMEIG